MVRLGKRALYFLWFYCDWCLLLRAAAALSGGRLPTQKAGAVNAVLAIAALCLTAAVVYPVFRQMEKKPALRVAAGSMAAAGYFYCLWVLLGQWGWMLPACAAASAALGYITVCGLKKPGLYW